MRLVGLARFTEWFVGILIVYWGIRCFFVPLPKEGTAKDVKAEYLPTFSKRVGLVMVFFGAAVPALPQIQIATNISSAVFWIIGLGIAGIAWALIAYLQHRYKDSEDDDKKDI